jgi:hypothetical protein
MKPNIARIKRTRAVVRANAAVIPKTDLLTDKTRASGTISLLSLS